MEHPVQPGLDWYMAQSSRMVVLPRCPFAALERCPRFFQGISLLGEVGIGTPIPPAEDRRLLEAWKKSDMWPRTNEDASSVMGPGDHSNHFRHFCPEVSFERFGLFATELSRYADEIDTELAHERLLSLNAASTDWRWAWSLARPMHYTDCPAYSPLMAQSSRSPELRGSRNLGGSDEENEGKAVARSEQARLAEALPTEAPHRPGGTGAMYSLLVSGDVSAWGGTPFVLDRARFLEFTDDEVKHQFGDFSEGALARLTRLPCIFAYEGACKRDPLFGVVRRIVPRPHDVRVEYEIASVLPFLSQDEFRALHSELAIEPFEYHRLHWAVKEVDLRRVLARVAVTLPPAVTWRQPANVATQHFDVGLSFPGEVRLFVKEVAECLEDLLGPDLYFYDDNYMAQLARPDLDLLLQDIYRSRSRLVVVFLCEAYERKPWCAGVEFRVVREMMKARNQDRIMLVKMDDGAVNGVLDIDGAVDGRKHGPSDIARMIKQRVDLLAR